MKDKILLVFDKKIVLNNVGFNIRFIFEFYYKI